LAGDLNGGTFISGRPLLAAHRSYGCRVERLICCVLSALADGMAFVC